MPTNQIKVQEFLSDITRAAETAAFLAQEVHEEYFEAYRMDNTHDRSCAAYDFDRQRVKMAVVLSAVEEINAAIKGINALNAFAAMESKEEKTRNPKKTRKDAEAAFVAALTGKEIESE